MFGEVTSYEFLEIEGLDLFCLDLGHYFMISQKSVHYRVLIVESTVFLICIYGLLPYIGCYS